MAKGRKCKWSACFSKRKVWVTEVPDFNGRTADFRQLWINGKKAVRARNVADFKQMARIVNNDVENEILGAC